MFLMLYKKRKRARNGLEDFIKFLRRYEIEMA